MFEDIYVVGTQRKLVSAEELDQLEATLGVKLPSDYRAFMTQLGVGSFCGSINEVYGLGTVLFETQFWQPNWVKHWDKKSDIIGPQTISDCIVVARANTEHLLMYIPTSEYYGLYRDDEDIPCLGNSFQQALKLFTEPYNGTRLKTPFFIPSSSSEIYLECEDTDEFTFEKAITCIANSKLASDWEIHDLDAYFFMPEHQGLIYLWDSGGEEAGVSFYGLDPASVPKLDSLIHELAQLGFEER